jgi:hypothetical protein
MDCAPPTTLDECCPSGDESGPANELEAFPEADDGDATGAFDAPAPARRAAAYEVRLFGGAAGAGAGAGAAAAAADCAGAAVLDAALPPAAPAAAAVAGALVGATAGECEDDGANAAVGLSATLFLLELAAAAVVGLALPPLLPFAAAAADTAGAGGVAEPEGILDRGTARLTSTCGHMQMNFQTHLEICFKLNSSYHFPIY